jgi:hypothetical protein
LREVKRVERRWERSLVRRERREDVRVGLAAQELRMMSGRKRET